MKPILLDQVIIPYDMTVKQAMHQLNVTAQRILLVAGADRVLLGTLSDGDIRRWILNEGSLGSAVGELMNRDPILVQREFQVEQCKQLMLERRIEWIPVVDQTRRIVDLVVWSDLCDVAFSEHHKRNIDIPVFIVAGGRGLRLEPFTKILPKPLMPYGEKPIVEVIMDMFSAYGCEQFILSLNYKGKMVQAYFDSIDCNHRIHYVWEDVPLGTAGSLRLSQDIVRSDDLFVSNCDILIKSDYYDIYEYHKKQDNDITVVSSLQHVSVPYGVIELKNGGALHGIVEKPEYDFLVNTGMYVIKRSVVKHVPVSGSFDFTHLIASVRNEGGKVGVYPVDRYAWVDIGQWPNYHDALKSIVS